MIKNTKADGKHDSKEGLRAALMTIPEPKSRMYILLAYMHSLTNGFHTTLDLTLSISDNIIKPMLD